MGVKFSNNGHSTLAASITSSDTSITVASGHGARFPSLGAGDYFYATLIDASNNLEIVKCTARSSDVLTVTRGQESTTARAYAIADRIELRVTALGIGDATNIDNTLPSQTSNSGKYLTTDGTNSSWGTVNQYSLPSQTGNSGKYLTTNGTSESWGTLSVVEHKVTKASTTSTATYTGTQSAWTDHITTSITTTKVAAVICHADFAHSYENGAVNQECRFVLSGTTTYTGDEQQIALYGFGSNRAMGSHNMMTAFQDVAAGTYTVKLQSRNNGGSGSTAYLNYFAGGGATATDRITILYK